MISRAEALLLRSERKRWRVLMVLFFQKNPKGSPILGGGGRENYTQPNPSISAGPGMAAAGRGLAAV